MEPDDIKKLEDLYRSLLRALLLDVEGNDENDCPPVRVPRPPTRRSGNSSIAVPEPDDAT